MTGLATCLLLLALAPGSGAPRQAASDLTRLEAFLARRPYHERVFEQLHRAAVESGGEADLVARYAERVGAEPGDTAARVVLARLEARRRRVREALELLAPVEDPAPELALLRGRLHLQLAEPAAAVPLLRSALDASREGGGPDAGRLAEGALDELARAQLLLGDRVAAAAALAEYAELAPESYTHRMESAARLVDASLDAAALEQLAVAAQLARGDPEREVRAWAAAAAVRERQGDLAGADELSARAARTLAPGHWRRAELLERRLALRVRLGTVPELCDELRAEIAGGAPDPDLPALLARALGLLGEEAARAEALDVLRAAAASFPDSIELARALAARVLTVEGASAAVAELQRVADRHPGAPGLHREAGLLLAGAGDIAAARRQWELELARAPGSIALHLDLAQLLDRFRAPEAAAALLRAAMDLDPADLRPVRALLDRGEPPQLLERVARRAARRSDSEALEEVAYEWLAREAPARAVAALRAAIDAGGDEARLLGLVVTVQEGAEGLEPEGAALLRLATLAARPPERVERSARFVASAVRDHRLGRARSEVAALEDEDLALALRALLAAEQGDAAEAGELLRELRARPGRAEEALRHAVHLAERRGDPDAVRAVWRELAALGPALRRESLEERSRVLRASGDLAAARAREEELLDAAPQSRSVLRELARRERTARAPGRAVELYQRLVDLDPGDAESRLDLAALLLVHGDRERGVRELSLVLGAKDADLRARARELLLRRVAGAEDPLLRAELVRFDTEHGELTLEQGALLAELLLAAGEVDEAVDILQRLVVRHGPEPAITEVAAAALGRSLRSLELPSARELAVLGADGEALRIALDLVGLGQGSAAMRVLADAEPVAAATVLLVGGDPVRAARVLREARRAAERDPARSVELLRRLAVAYRAAGSPARAATALEEALTLLDPARPLHRWPLLVELGEIMRERRLRSGLRSVGEQLLEGLAATRALLESPESSLVGRRLHERRVAEAARFHLTHGLGAVFVDAALDATALDLALTRSLLECDWGLRPRERAAALDRLAVRPYGAWNDREWQALRGRHRGAAPDESSPTRWGRLDGR